MAFFAMTLLVGDNPQIYMVKQLVGSGATIPFLWSLWKQDVYEMQIVFGKSEQRIGQWIAQGILVMLAMTALGAAINNLIVMTPLVEVSSGFQTANEQFFAGGMLMEIFASCMIVPIAEELLFRGVVLKRVSMLSGDRMGILLSAILFGAVHGNLVQFLYAVILGILLAVIVKRTKSVSLAVAGHAAANLVAITRAETGLLDFSYRADVVGIGFTLILLVVGSVFLWLLLRQCGTSKYKEEKH